MSHKGTPDKDIEKNDLLPLKALVGSKSFPIRVIDFFSRVSTASLVKNASFKWDLLLLVYLTLTLHTAFPI